MAEPKAPTQCEHGQCKAGPQTTKQSLYTNSKGTWCAAHLPKHPDDLPELPK